MYGNGISNGFPSSIQRLSSLNNPAAPNGPQVSSPFSNSNGSSPGSTFPRRPPRSKHDLSLPPIKGGVTASTSISMTGVRVGERNVSNEYVTLPSKEAPHRVLIGTQMLQGSQNNKHPNIISQLHQQSNSPEMPFQTSPLGFARKQNVTENGNNNNHSANVGEV